TTGAITSTEKVPPDNLTLQDIARETGGQFFAAPDAAKLQAVYSNLGTRLAKVMVKHPVTSAFPGGAIVPLLAGAGLGRTRGARLPGRACTSSPSGPRTSQGPGRSRRPSCATWTSP